MGIVFPITDKLKDEAVTALMIKPIYIDVEYMNSLDRTEDMTILDLEQLGESNVDWEYLYVERLGGEIFALDDSIKWEGIATLTSNAYVVCSQVGTIFWIQEYDLSSVTNGSFTIEFTDPLVTLSDKIYIGI